MKRYFLAILAVFTILSMNAQDAQTPLVQVGDVLEIGSPDAPRYKHIDFPRPNFIIKKGGIANYKRMRGKKVVVTSVQEKKDGTLQIKIKRADGGKFFNSHTLVSVDLKNALESGELNVL